MAQHPEIGDPRLDPAAEQGAGGDDPLEPHRAAVGDVHARVAEFQDQIEIGRADGGKIHAAHGFLELAEIGGGEGGGLFGVVFLQFPTGREHLRELAFRHGAATDAQQETVEKGAQGVVFREVIAGTGEEQRGDGAGLSAAAEDAFVQSHQQAVENGAVGVEQLVEENDVGLGQHALGVRHEIALTQAADVEGAEEFVRLGEARECGGFDIYAADGHYQHAAAHDPKRGAEGGQTIATGHFFRLDLRCHHLGYIALGEPDAGKKKSHDITVIKRATPEALRNGAAKGRKVIYAWDKACIDYHLWHRLKHNSGVYFITIEKSNSAAEVCSLNLIDPADPRNEGIAGDHFVGTSNGVQLRRITYTDPRDGTHYTYLTNEMTLPAHQLVIIYKCRWDIEKAFNELKGKMEERKSWASGQEAKRAHGQFECLAHNLTLLAEREMKELGLEDKVEMKKGIRRGGTRRDREGKPMAQAANFIGQAVVRATQRTVRFIRWLRAHIYSEAPLGVSAARLAAVWGC